MINPIDTSEDVERLTDQFNGLKTCMELDIINNGGVRFADVVELLTLAEDMLTQLRFDYLP